MLASQITILPTTDRTVKSEVLVGPNMPSDSDTDTETPPLVEITSARTVGDPGGRGGRDISIAVMGHEIDPREHPLLAGAAALLAVVATTALLLAMAAVFYAVSATVVAAGSLLSIVTALAVMVTGAFAIIIVVGTVLQYTVGWNPLYEVTYEESEDEEVYFHVQMLPVLHSDDE